MKKKFKRMLQKLCLDISADYSYNDRRHHLIRSVHKHNLILTDKQWAELENRLKL